MDLWSSLLEPGLGLASGPSRVLRGFFQELCHEALEGPGTVLWCDGDHGFDPYEFAERNMVRGLSAEQGADRRRPQAVAAAR